MTKGLKTILDQLQEKVDWANQEAERIVSEAEAKAAQIEAEARARAGEQAKAFDEKLRKAENVHRQRLEHATRDALMGLKEQTRKTMLNHALQEVVIRHVRDPQFVREAVLEMCVEFARHAGNDADLRVLLGEDVFQRMGREIEKAVQEKIGEHVSVEGLPGIRGGFQLGVSGQSYVYDFTDEAMAELFSAAFGEKIAAHLFGEPEKDA